MAFIMNGLLIQKRTASGTWHGDCLIMLGIVRMAEMFPSPQTRKQTNMKLHRMLQIGLLVSTIGFLVVPRANALPILNLDYGSAHSAPGGEFRVTSTDG